MDKKFTLILCIMIMLVSQVFAGEFVSYTDPKTGVRFYGDSVPANVPKNVEIEERNFNKMPVPVSTVGSSFNWVDTAKGQYAIQPTERLSTQPAQTTTGTQVQMPQESLVSQQVRHWSNQPTRPSNHPVFRDFNRATNQHDKYEANMFEWRSQGRELGVSPRAPGFSQEEKRYYKSYSK